MPGAGSPGQAAQGRRCWVPSLRGSCLPISKGLEEETRFIDLLLQSPMPFTVWPLAGYLPSLSLSSLPAEWGRKSRPTRGVWHWRRREFPPLWPWSAMRVLLVQTRTAAPWDAFPLPSARRSFMTPLLRTRSGLGCQGPPHSRPAAGTTLGAWSWGTGEVSSSHCPSSRVWRLRLREGCVPEMPFPVFPYKVGVEQYSHCTPGVHFQGAVHAKQFMQNGAWCPVGTPW